jgi:hypothetical protein
MDVVPIFTAGISLLAVVGGILLIAAMIAMVKAGYNK